MKNHFNSNETLECCDVSVSQQGNIAVDPKKYNADGMERLGVPRKSVRGRVRVMDGLIKFDPYDEASRRPTFLKQVVVGSTTLSVTEDKVKVSFLVARHMSKEIMLMYIQSEIDEVKRRLALDVYDAIVVKTLPTPPLKGGNSGSADSQVLPQREDLGGSQEGGNV